MLLLILLRPGPGPAPVEWAMPVGLVRLDERTESPRHPDKAALPQEAAPARPALPAPLKRPAPPRPKARTAHSEDFDAQLRAAATAAGTTAAPASGTADRSLAADTGAAGRQASVSVRDFVRAQVERHWNFDVAALGALPDVIAVHVVLDDAGNVGSVAVVEDPRRHADPAYHALAISARNAVLVSSPIRLPPGIPASLRDMVLELDPRAALR